MLLGITLFIACLAAVGAVIALHECGHFIAGIASGIPPRELKIRLAAFPQHVALRDGEAWLHPVHDYARYVARTTALIPHRLGAVAYVAGGLVGQSAAVVLFAWGATTLGLPRLWLLPLLVALTSVPIIYLVADVVATCMRRQPCGDFSFLWRISPAASVATTSATFGAHVFALSLIW